MDSPCIKLTVYKVLKIFQHGKYLVAYVFKINIQPLIFWDILQAGQTMICNNTYLNDIQRVCEIKDLIWVIRFQSH